MTKVRDVQIRSLHLWDIRKVDELYTSHSGAMVEGSENPRPELDQSVIPNSLATVLFGDAGCEIVGPLGGEKKASEIAASVPFMVKRNCVPGDLVIIRTHLVMGVYLLTVD